MKKQRKKPALVPRLGPPVNLRPGGAHGDKRRKSRAERQAAEEMKAALGDDAAFDVTAPSR